MRLFFLITHPVTRGLLIWLAVIWMIVDLLICMYLGIEGLIAHWKFMKNEQLLAEERRQRNTHRTGENNEI